MGRLTNKQRAMLDALQYIAELYKPKQKCEVFGTKFGNWSKNTGTVISIEFRNLTGRKWNGEKFVDSKDTEYSCTEYNSSTIFNNKDKIAGRIKYMYCTFANPYEAIPKAFISRIVDKDKEEAVFEEYKRYFTKFFNSWDGDDNDNKHREVIALIGSTRFKDTFLEKCWDFSSKGYVVTLPNFRPDSLSAKDFDIPEDILEDIGFKRIDIADKVFVINQDGYIGNSTKKEIYYAEDCGKCIRYLVEEDK